MPTDYSKLCGWRSNPKAVEAVLNSPEVRHPEFDVAAPHLLKAAETRKDTHLWLYLAACSPDYRRGAQGIGDCVSWGGEMAATILNAKRCVKSNKKYLFLEGATEANYGGCRVEVFGGRNAGYSDGANGAAMAKFLLNWGQAWRADYSERTKNPEHDLRKYSSQKAKQWGNFGCGGKNDKGLLDAIAKENPVRVISRVRTFEESYAAVTQAQNPVTIASMYGCSMRRDKYGQCGWSDSWAHQMCLIAGRMGSHPGMLCAQSWGAKSASGPSGDEYTENLPPGGMPANILGFTWWIPADVCNRIFRSGDCWVIGDLPDYKVDKYDPLKLFTGFTR